MLFSIAQPNAARAAVTLVDMTATAQSDGTILVEWETATELGTAAFNLYRAEASNGPWDMPVDTQPAQGDGQNGASYSFSDDDVTAGKTYYYLLEELDNSGTRTKLNDFIRSATVSVPGQATFTPTATSTVTRTPTPGPSPTPTRTRTPLPGPTDLPTDVPTATRQFQNTSVPPNTPTSTIAPAPGQPTATRAAGSPTVTPITAPQLATPTRLPGAAAPVAPPAATQPASGAPPTAAPTVAATATWTPTRTSSATPTVARTPSATPSPAVFGAKATAEPILRGTLARTNAPVQGDDGRNEGLVLAVGGGAVLLAALLGGAAFVIWRRRRS
ncbi:MAG: hypothetical protein MUC51_03405 [Anaerolineae bacterium]|jgi:hypothetical protein|nr:hypothetical protein [Anaerolineae bacterium]